MSEEFDSGYMPGQAKEKSHESQLEYSADKMFNSSEKEDAFVLRQQLQQVHSKLLSDQVLIQHCRVPRAKSHNSQQSQYPDEKQITELSHYGDCEVSDIKKNLSINQDLSLMHCERVLQTEHHQESKRSHELRSSNLATMHQREIQLKNNQIAELQRRIMESEKQIIQRDCEELSHSQSLERKVQQLQDQNHYLQRSQERNKMELHQTQLQMQQISEQNTQLQGQVLQLQEQLKNQDWVDADQEEYQRLKAEFEEFQRLTHHVLSQDEECQRKLLEQERDLQQQAQIQEDLENQLRESEEMFEQRIHQMKKQFQMDYDIALRRIQDQNITLREQNQFLFDQLQHYELEKQNIEEYFLNEIEEIKSQYNCQFAQFETNLKMQHEKQIQDKNSLITQLQDQLRQYTEPQPETGLRSKSLSAQNGINKFLVNKSQNSYYLPGFKNSQSMDEDIPYLRQKNNNTFHQLSAQNNTSGVFNRKLSHQQNQSYTKTIILNSNSKAEKENLRDWEKQAIVLQQKQQNEQYIQEQYSKQKGNLYLRQLDGDYKYSPHLNSDSNSRYQYRYGNDSRSNMSTHKQKK